MKENTKKLESVGLTKREAQIYLMLLEVPGAKAGEICAKTGIKNSHIYDILEKLLEKGLINYKIENNIKIFRAANPEALYAKFHEKEEQLEKEKTELKEFITSLKQIPLKENKLNDFKYFEGISGIRSMLTELIDNTPANSELVIAPAKIAYEKMNPFLLEYFHPQRIRKKIKQCLLVPKSMKQHGKEREKIKFLTIKYTDLELESEFATLNDYFYLLSESEKPYGLLIKDKNFANAMTKVFDQLWSQGKPS
jgi:sugar-specific transcriptional regulator TrmB